MDDIEVSLHDAITAGRIHGAVICATNSEGPFVYNKAFGKRTLLSGKTRPQQLDDALFLASATKLLTTIAALQCVDDGFLALDNDLISIAPELAAKQVLTGFAEDGETPLLELAARPITLKMLLAHTSGLSYHFFESKCRKVAGKPGDGWMYGPGLDWAGRVVERMTGFTLGERMQQRIFDPLEITDGQFCPVTRKDLRARLVNLTPDDPDALGRAVLGGGGEMNKRTNGDFGGHGYFLPDADCVKVLQSLLANDGKLLKTTTVEHMFQNHLNSQAMASHQSALASPRGPFFRVGTDPGMKVGYG